MYFLYPVQSSSRQFAQLPYTRHSISSSKRSCGIVIPVRDIVSNSFDATSICHTLVMPRAQCHTLVMPRAQCHTLVMPRAQCHIIMVGCVCCVVVSVYLSGQLHIAATMTSLHYQPIINSNLAKNFTSQNSLREILQNWHDAAVSLPNVTKPFSLQKRAPKMDALFLESVARAQLLLPNETAGSWSPSHCKFHTVAKPSDDDGEACGAIYILERDNQLLCLFANRGVMSEEDMIPGTSGKLKKKDNIGQFGIGLKQSFVHLMCSAGAKLGVVTGDKMLHYIITPSKKSPGTHNLEYATSNNTAQQFTDWTFVTLAFRNPNAVVKEMFSVRQWRMRFLFFSPHMKTFDEYKVTNDPKFRGAVYVQGMMLQPSVRNANEHRNDACKLETFSPMILRFAYSFDKQLPLASDRNAPYSEFNLLKYMQEQLCEVISNSTANDANDRQHPAYVVFDTLFKNKNTYRDITGLAAENSPFITNVVMCRTMAKLWENCNASLVIDPKDLDSEYDNMNLPKLRQLFKQNTNQRITIVHNQLLREMILTAEPKFGALRVFHEIKNTLVTLPDAEQKNATDKHFADYLQDYAATFHNWLPEQVVWKDCKALRPFGTTYQPYSDKPQQLLLNARLWDKKSIHATTHVESGCSSATDCYCREYALEMLLRLYPATTTQTPLRDILHKRRGLISKHNASKKSSPGGTKRKYTGQVLGQIREALKTMTAQCTTAQTLHQQATATIEELQDKITQRDVTIVDLQERLKGRDATISWLKLQLEVTNSKRKNDIKAMRETAMKLIDDTDTLLQLRDDFTTIQPNPKRKRTVLDDPGAPLTPPAKRIKPNTPTTNTSVSVPENDKTAIIVK